MSANENQAHESFIKTPRRLVVVVLLSFVVPIILIVLLSQLVTSGSVYDKNSPAMSAAEIAKRIKPVADAGIVETGAGGATLKSGEEIYKSACTACHTTGVSKAPKFGDRRDWAAHLSKGQRALVQTAIKGLGAMPPRGGASGLSDAEVERAVVYMANAAGAKFRDAAVPAPAQAVAAKGNADGKKIYETTCIACHAAGVANAPKFGDKAAWAPHLQHGVAEIYQTALKGKGAMPPKGGNLTLSEAEVKAAVDYMVNAVR